MRARAGARIRVRHVMRPLYRLSVNAVPSRTFRKIKGRFPAADTLYNIFENRKLSSHRDRTSDSFQRKEEAGERKRLRIEDLRIAQNVERDVREGG
jgi:hypothetical protein